MPKQEKAEENLGPNSVYNSDAKALSKILAN